MSGAGWERCSALGRHVHGCGPAAGVPTLPSLLAEPSCAAALAAQALPAPCCEHCRSPPLAIPLSTAGPGLLPS